jgi:hypothetical protein
MNRTGIGVLVFVVVLLASIVAPNAYAGYGAIYYNPTTGSFGRSWGYGDRRGAEMRALGECESSSSRGDCQRVTTIWGRQCGALAVSDGGRWRGGHAGTLEQAQYRALNHCIERSGQRCRVLTSVCTD